MNKKTIKKPTSTSTPTNQAGQNEKPTTSTTTTTTTTTTGSQLSTAQANDQMTDYMSIRNNCYDTNFRLYHHNTSLQCIYCDSCLTHTKQIEQKSLLSS